LRVRNENDTKMKLYNFSDTVEVPECGTYQLIEIENKGIANREIAIYERVKWNALAPWIVKIKANYDTQV